MKAVARGSGSGSAATQYLRVGNHQTLEEVDKGVFVVEVDGSKTITLAISHSSGNFENQCTVKLGFSRLHSPHPRPPSTLPHCLTLCHHLMLCCVLRVAPSIRTQGQMSCADAASSSAREKCDRCGTSRDAGLAHMASVMFRSESVDHSCSYSSFNRRSGPARNSCPLWLLAEGFCSMLDPSVHADTRAMVMTSPVQRASTASCCRQPNRRPQQQ